MICAFAANLMYVGQGIIFATSGFLIPKLEDPTDGFGISIDEGSWVGKLSIFVRNHVKLEIRSSVRRILAMGLGLQTCIAGRSKVPNG